jgi:hypothetical protein
MSEHNEVISATMLSGGVSVKPAFEERKTTTLEYCLIYMVCIMSSLTPYSMAT